MNLPGCVVIEGAREWLIVAGNETERLALDVEPAELAVCAKVMIGLSGLKNPGCVLAPDATSCFFAKLSLPNDFDIRDRSALTFELEGHLPMDAESMVADFRVVPSSHADKTVAAVAISIERWRLIADEMESVGLPVRSIVPRSILATRSVMDTPALREAIETDDPVELLLVEADRCDAVTLQKQTICSWTHMAINRTALRCHRSLDDGVSDRAFVVGADADQQSEISDSYPNAIWCDDELDGLVVRGAAMLLSNRAHSWFDLRRDALGPSDPLRAVQGQIRFLLFAAAVCFFTAAVGGWWRAHRIEKEIAQIRGQQQKMFQEAFPGSRLPGALVRRVRSEHLKVLGSRGETSEVDVPVSATKILKELLVALPRTIRFRVTSVKILDGQIDLDLQVRSPVDAGALATSLSSAGFEVKPPGTTQKDAKTFESLLEAKWIGRPKAATVPDGNVSIKLIVLTEAAG